MLGGTAPAVYNAANEECVDAFHDGRIGFLSILDIVAAVLDEHTRRRSSSGRKSGARPNPDVGSTLVNSADLTLEVVLAADAWARARARELAAAQREQLP